MNYWSSAVTALAKPPAVNVEEQGAKKAPDVCRGCKGGIESRGGKQTLDRPTVSQNARRAIRENPDI